MKFSSGQGNATEFLNIQSDGSDHQRHSYIHMVYIRTPPQSTTIRPGPGRLFITHQVYRETPLPEQDRMRNCVLSLYFTRDQAIAVIDRQASPYQVCVNLGKGIFPNIGT